MRPPQYQLDTAHTVGFAGQAELVESASIVGREVHVSIGLQPALGSTPGPAAVRWAVWYWNQDCECANTVAAGALDLEDIAESRAAATIAGRAALEDIVECPPWA